LQKLSDIPKFTPVFWRSLGELLSNTIRNRVKGHKNFRDANFKPYSKKFSGVGWRTINGRSVFLDSYKNRKMAGKAAPKGQSQVSTSGTPDMRLTGKTMADLQTRKVTKDSVTIGWLGFTAEVVQFLHDMKNYKIVGLIGTKILAKKELKIIENAIGDNMQKRIDKYHSEDVNININIEF